MILNKKSKDLTGMIFGYWSVIGLSHKGVDRQYYWFCKCKCGSKKTVLGKNLKSGMSKSCGCYRIKQSIDACKTHGLSNHPIYSIWKAMIRRCTNINDPGYKSYGGRGIYVCTEWLLSPQIFINDMYEKYKKSLTIDRIDNNDGYHKENCRWVSAKFNNRNKSTSKSVLRTNIKTGETKIYTRITDVIQDGFHQGHVSYCCLGKLKHHKKYYWKYISLIKV